MLGKEIDKYGTIGVLDGRAEMPRHAMWKLVDKRDSSCRPINLSFK